MRSTATRRRHGPRRSPTSIGSRIDDPPGSVGADVVADRHAARRSAHSTITGTCRSRRRPVDRRSTFLHPTQTAAARSRFPRRPRSVVVVDDRRHRAAYDRRSALRGDHRAAGGDQRDRGAVHRAQPTPLAAAPVCRTDLVDARRTGRSQFVISPETIAQLLAGEAVDGSALRRRGARTSLPGHIG